ncbi:DNA ligase 3-like [Liolophura sinensis]|uniref:DNA ligase 3-like n=1 Tax=Liolophura sinensis TaxID=3198878 RepID=UPI00315846F5
MISCRTKFCTSLRPSLKLLVRHIHNKQYLRTASEVCHPLRHNSIPSFPLHIPDFKHPYHWRDNYKLPLCDCNIFNFTMAENKFIIGYAKLGTSSCKKCKQKIAKQSLRIGKVVPNPFGDGGGDMKQWHHPACIFETFKRARASTKIIEEPDDLEGFTDLQDEDKKLVNKLIKEFFESSPQKKKAAGQAKLPKTVTPKKEVKTEVPTSAVSSTRTDDAGDDAPSGAPSSGENGKSEFEEKDNSFRQFRRLCADIAEENSYNGKTQLVSNYLRKGSRGDGFQGDVYLLMKLLLPGVVKSVYNLNNKQLVKLYSQAFGTSLKDMVEDLEQGDVAETVRIFFEQNKVIPVPKKSTLSLQEVDSLLEELAGVTKEEDQQKILTKIAKKSTGNDLKMIVRLIKHDIRINAGAKHILDGLDENAYAAFQASRNLRDVVDRVLANKNESKPGMSKKLSVRASLMTPVLPMLAEACRSVEQAMRKCPNGFYAEIKYDGERVQLHKKGGDFQYFSRSLKPVLPHKVNHFKEYIPKAFPTGDDLILDSEVLLIDTQTSKPLPFGTLGKHKKEAFKDANVCLFVFDCLHINGENLMDKPIKERRKILHEEMIEIKNHVMFSEMQYIRQPDDLNVLMTKVFREGLEGLVLKDVNSIYEPGKRHWLKVKKDYLAEGSMADTADLVVLGGYYGSGNKGGIMSVFLTGVHDPATDKWCTVTKVGNGFDDKTLERLQTELKMVKISKDQRKVPDWLKINKTVIPDFVVADPKTAPVWEITGAEFSKSESHTAGGISIRFPRLTKFRDDKDWKEATNLPRLKELFKQSKETSDFPNLAKGRKGKFAKKEETNKSSDDDIMEIDPSESNLSSPQKTPRKESMSSNNSTPAKAKNGVVTSGEGENDAGDNVGVKRKIDVETDSPNKKAKQICRYGADCYQANPEHREKYGHPPAVPAYSPNKNLPDVFRGVKIYLPSNLEKFKELKRYIIAFDGDVVSEVEKSEATHIISDKGKSPVSKNGITVCVTSAWLWACIRKKTLVPVDKYKP